MSNMSNDHNILRSIHIFFWIIIGMGIILFFIPRFENYLVKMTAKPQDITARGDLSDLEKTNIEIFRQASPSVVYITTLSDMVNLWTRDITRIPRGTGSGFIWDRHGHIITNYHVLQGASVIRIRLSDQRTFNAVLVGASPNHDIAVLRMPIVSNMPSALPIGTSHDLQVGQMMYAIGNPFGLDQTLTTGIVSALNRSLYNDNGSQIKGLIQTDAAINPGNSGGPLLDSAGRLVGINTAIYSPSGAYAGIGLAVPVDTVNRIVPQLIAHGKYERPKLGITIDNELNKLITDQYGIKGVAVIEVQQGSSAEAAGLKGVERMDKAHLLTGDIILGIDGHEIEDINTLLSTLEKYQIGDRIKLRYLREKKENTISLILK
ncbi:S1C family serine protease [Sulfurovum sp.]|uniref:S1C family serine protease n=1 Tax=Sulfurovum sp. TaxID=1969726 RepID=UPI0035661700